MPTPPTLSRATEAAILELWKRTNYNATMWPFIMAPTHRHLELRIDDAVYVDLCAIAPAGDTETMLRAYFARHANNIAMWVDGSLLIFDKDDAELLSRSYLRISPSFFRMIRAVFALSVVLLAIGAVAFLTRLFVDSEIVDAVLVLAVFFFLANATVGIGSILLGCHRLYRDDTVIASLPAIHYIEILP